MKNTFRIDIGVGNSEFQLLTVVILLIIMFATFPCLIAVPAIS